MKQLFRYVQSGLLSIILLLTGNGFTINRMECLHSGKSNVTIGRPASCCPQEEEGTCSLKRKCCRVETTVCQSNTFSIQDKKENRPVTQQPDFCLFYATVSCRLSSLTHSPSTAAFPLKPPLSGKDLSIKISVLLI